MYVYVYVCTRANISQGQVQNCWRPSQNLRRIVGKWRALNLKTHSFHGTSDCVHIPSCKLWLHFTQQRKRAPVLSQMLSPCWGRGRRKNQMGQGQSPEKPPGWNWNRLLRRDRTRRESQASQAVGLLSPLLKAAGCSLDSGPLLKINFPHIGACHHCWELACDSYTLGYTMYNACWIASRLN